LIESWTENLEIEVNQDESEKIPVDIIFEKENEKFSVSILFSKTFAHISQQFEIAMKTDLKSEIILSYFTNPKLPSELEYYEKQNIYSGQLKMQQNRIDPANDFISFHFFTETFGHIEVKIKFNVFKRRSIHSLPGIYWFNPD
jgi:hypothetical protein